MPYTQLTAQWSGFTGSPGWTRMRFLGSLTSAEIGQKLGDMRTFFSSMNSQLPNSVTISFQSIGQVFSDAGELQGEVTGTPPSAMVGVSATNVAAPAGAVVQWTTGQFVAGHRIRGRTFLVPLASGAYEANGTLSGTAVTAIQGAANTLASALIPLVVVSRNKAGDVIAVTQVNGAIVPDRVAVLRSRRD